MTRQAKAAKIRQGHVYADALIDVLSGKTEGAPMVVIAMADRLKELAEIHPLGRERSGE